MLAVWSKSFVLVEYLIYKLSIMIFSFRLQVICRLTAISYLIQSDHFLSSGSHLDIEALGAFRPPLFLISGFSGCLAEGLWGFFVTSVSILDIYAWGTGSIRNWRMATHG